MCPCQSDLLVSVIATKHNRLQAISKIARNCIWTRCRHENKGAIQTHLDRLTAVAKDLTRLEEGAKGKRGPLLAGRRSVTQTANAFENDDGLWSRAKALEYEAT